MDCNSRGEFFAAGREDLVVSDLTAASPGRIRLCHWCLKNEAFIGDLYGPISRCELSGCDAVFCDSQCSDLHLAKHEDSGDCVRDRNGSIITA